MINEPAFYFWQAATDVNFKSNDNRNPFGYKQQKMTVFTFYEKWTDSHLSRFLSLLMRLKPCSLKLRKETAIRDISYSKFHNKTTTKHKTIFFLPIVGYINGKQ